MAKTLTDIFESNKSVLEGRLKDMKLPSDSSKIQKVVNNYLNEMFDNDGEFRQSLTQSEDYILQAALSLLNAQQAIVKETISEKTSNHSNSFQQYQTFSGLKQTHYPHTLAGTTIGSGVGGLLWGTWGAVFGAIAGTAIILYYASSQSTVSSALAVQETTNHSPLNIKSFLSIVKNLCENIDSMINTFRAQINRVIHKYENQEKPTLERDYRFLIEGIQSLVGYKRSHNEAEDKYIKKLQERIEDIVELLDNYNLTIEDYSEANKKWFEIIENTNIEEIVQVLPAIVKNQTVVLKGRIFIPLNV